jgi:glycosyltransferase involved in cell wall biosynthesis
VVGNTPPVPEVAPTYENWLQHASHLLTTSVAEGFGLAFLEPLTLGKPLLGRDLPEITADFRADGIPLGDLYERILVPWSWIDADALHDALESNLRSSYGSYGRPLNDAILDEAFAALHFGDRLDFGNLPEEFQQAVAARAYKAPGEVLLETDGRRVPLGDWLAESLAAPGPPREASAVAAYSLDSCGKRLTALYRELLATQHSQAAWLDKSLVLDRFLLPGRFHFLRT